MVPIPTRMSEKSDCNDGAATTPLSKRMYINGENQPPSGRATWKVIREIRSGAISQLANDRSEVMACDEANHKIPRNWDSQDRSGNR